MCAGGMLNLIKCVVLLVPQCNLPSWLVVLEKKVGEKKNWERYRYKRERASKTSSTQSAPRSGRPYEWMNGSTSIPSLPVPPPEENRFLYLVQTSKQSSGIFFLSHVRVIIPFPLFPPTCSCIHIHQAQSSSSLARTHHIHPLENARSRMMQSFFASALRHAQRVPLIAVVVGDWPANHSHIIRRFALLHV
jgi:hypothetical protein